MSRICHVIFDSVIHLKAILCLLTAVYCTFLIPLSIVLSGNSPPLICTIPSCQMRWILKQRKRLHTSLLIYTDGFPLISKLKVSQMSSLISTVCIAETASVTKAKITLQTLRMQRHATKNKTADIKSFLSFLDTRWFKLPWQKPKHFSTC